MSKMNRQQSRVPVCVNRNEEEYELVALSPHYIRILGLEKN